MALSNLEKALLTVIGIDIATPGFSRAAAKAAVGALVRATPPLAAGVTTTATRLASANPALTGTAIGLGALQTEPGQDLLAAAAERGRMDRIRFEQFLTDAKVKTQTKVTRSKRKASKFSKAVGQGMKIAKASTSYGKKGVLSSPKKAFTAVTKTASAINKGRKVAKSGIKRKLGLAMRKILK
tara:strand:+ start:17 stop:565 length:549 start_codon:yes stop_codon:yes gene_type:complete